jgi:hypothetical protein
MDHYLLGNQDNLGFIKERVCLNFKGHISITCQPFSSSITRLKTPSSPLLYPVSGPPRAPTSLGRGSISKSEILIQFPNYLRPQLGALKACFTMCLCITVSRPGIIRKNNLWKELIFPLIASCFSSAIRRELGTKDELWSARSHEGLQTRWRQTLCTHANDTFQNTFLDTNDMFHDMFVH